MNQAILFNDDLKWHHSSQKLTQSALYSGAIIQCIIHLSYLKSKGFDESADKKAVQDFCALISFDIEEDAQQAIEDELMSDEGIIELN